MNVSGQEWVWYGGRVSLDFVNTRRDRAASPVEYLRDAGELAGWLSAAKLASEPVEVDAAGFADALALREDIDALVRACVEGTTPPDPALGQVNDWLTAAPGPLPALRRAGDLMILETGPRQPGLRAALAAIALDAAQLAGTGLRDRLRVCPGAHCGGRFLDRSAAGRRRWCSMAVCGNRQKVSSHRQATPGPR
jgi:predicted RNA-binding Zn ribbon-like protein